MVQDLISTWSRLVARVLAILTYVATGPHSLCSSQDQREYRQEWEWQVGDEELAWANIRENLN
jgi:hypothetical protein